jgi:hypothetical protein
MKRLAVLAIGLLLALPAPAQAARKSILRFHEKSKQAKVGTKPEKPTLPSVLAPASASPLLGGPSLEGWLLRLPSEKGRLLNELGTRPDWFGEKFSAAEGAEEGAEQGDQTQEPSPQGAFPGTPAVQEPLPPAALPAPGPAPEGTTLESGPENTAIPAPAPHQAPPTYAPAPVGVPTVTGYDASVAPPNAVRIPPYQPALPGQPPPPPRALPRLAPYGTALPPNQTTPPAAIPR